MNIVANNVASKLFVAFVAVAMLFTLVTPAKAATTAELQQMINDLLAQVSSLQGQLGQGGSSAAGVCPYTWTRTLTTGATGADVMKLQQFLNADADTRVSASGVGSAGMESEYFGPATAAAVSKFQTKYRSDVLSPAGLVNPTGTFGPATMAKANSLCASAPVIVDDSSDDEDDTTTDDEDDNSSSDLSGEASLQDVNMKDGDDTTIEEGQEDAPVADMEVEFTDGDAMITRIDLALVGSGDETEPWDTFETVSLWVDGDKVAEMAADNEDDYLDEDDGSLRFSGLDIVAMEDDQITITIGVTVQGSVDINGNSDAWTVDADAIRYVDGDDVSSTDTTTGDLGNTGTAFDVDVEGGDDELAVKSSSEDPDATTIQVDETDKSDFTTIFAYTLDTDDSTNDIVVDGLTVNVSTPNDIVNQVVDDIQLLIDGTVFDDVTWVKDDEAVARATFDLDKDLTIEAGDEVTVEVQVEFAALTGNYDEGDTIFASTTSATIDAEGADNLAGAQLSGSATGETHTLRTEGAVMELTDSSETKDTNSDTTTTDDEGVFVLEFEVTAFESDLYVAKSAASSTGTGQGVSFRITDGSGTLSGTSSVPTASLSSSADSETGTDSVSRFKVAEGETETFTLTVTLDPEVSGFYGVQIYSFNFKTANTAAATVNQQLALPAADFETDPLSI